MKKTTIELHRIKDTTACVGHTGIPFWQDSASTMDVIVEWSERPENLSQKVYKHIVYSNDENIRHEPHSWANSNNSGYVYSHKCDHVTYLDIYHQDK
jgi:hypothetical protein